MKTANRYSFTLLILMSVILSALVLVSTAGNVAAAPQPYNFQVYAKENSSSLGLLHHGAQPCQNTNFAPTGGIQINAGDVVAGTASGRWSHDPGTGLYGPDGKYSGVECTGFKVGVLVMKFVANDGTSRWIRAGSSFTTTINQSGRLYFAFSDSDQTNNRGSVNVSLTVNGAPIICSANSQCGTDGFNGSPVCGLNGDVYENYTTYVCNNPGTADSSCSHTDESRLFADCTASQICTSGACVNQNITCTTNSDCTGNGYIGTPYCYNSATVYQTYRTYTCQNPGAANSSCVSTNAEQQKNICTASQTCSTGTCINQNIRCASDSECGTNTVEGNPFCQGNSVYKNFRTYTCNSPGSANSSCSSTVNSQFQNNCTGNQTCNTSTGSCTDLNNLVVSSYATPNPANVNQQVSFIATATGGTGSYAYSWTGDCAGSGQVCNTAFSQSGTHTVTVTVTSGAQTSVSVATVVISQNCTQQAERRCDNSSVYWYDSCGARDGLIQSCQYGCSNGYCNNQTCASHSCQQCVGSYLYWYNSCGNQEGQSQYCQYGCSGNSCNQNNCAYHSYQRCSGNYLYWYDSCGTQQDSQYCQYGCSNNYCQNQNINYSNLTVDVTAKNLTTGLGWYGNIAASPSDVLMFMITIQAQGNQNANNVFVRDILPYGLTYRNNLIVAGSNNYNGDITSGINIGTISAGQTVTITYQAQVASAANFNYGISTLTDNVSVTASGNTPNVNNATVTVARTAVYGATSISTGLTNNFLADSFFLPLMLALLGVWFFRSGIFGFEKWADAKKIAVIGYRAQKQLSAKIAKIRKQENN